MTPDIQKECRYCGTCRGSVIAPRPVCSVTTLAGLQQNDNAKANQCGNSCVIKRLEEAPAE